MCSHSSHRPSPGGEFGISPGIGGYQHHRSSPGAELGTALQLQLSWGSALQLISALRPLSKSCSTRQKSLNRPFPAFVGLQALNFCRSRDTVFAYFRRSHPLPLSDQAAHLQGLRARQQSLTVSCRSLRISFWLSPALMLFARSSRVFCVPLLVVLSFGEVAAG